MACQGNNGLREGVAARWIQEVGAHTHVHARLWLHGVQSLKGAWGGGPGLVGRKRWRRKEGEKGDGEREGRGRGECGRGY